MERLAEHQDELFAYAKRQVRDDDDAHDLVQETFLRAIKYWDSYDESKDLRGWLYGILRRRIFTFYSKRDRERDLQKLLRQSARSEQMETPTPEDELIWAEVDDHVMEALAQLSPKELEVLRRYDIEDQTYKEAAKALGITPQTVLWRAYVGRKRLRKLLAVYAEDVGAIEDATPYLNDETNLKRKPKG